MPTVKIEDIITTNGTQQRSEIDEAVVAEYAEAYRNGATLPPVIVFSDGTQHVLADGFHRVHAAANAGRTEIEADVRPGTVRDAILHACGANATHGLRRTNADKRRAVQTVLADPEWSTWSDREIARRTGTTHPFVAKVRAEAMALVTVTARPVAESVPFPLPAEGKAIWALALAPGWLSGSGIVAPEGVYCDVFVTRSIYPGLYHFASTFVSRDYGVGHGTRRPVPVDVLWWHISNRAGRCPGQLRWRAFDFPDEGSENPFFGSNREDAEEAAFASLRASGRWLELDEQAASWL